ncbi:hypothetical protein [Lactiplantibacillus fabifermentans]|uniref:Phage protein n=1 Tax=Lactiplantibacillus fabifermentans DSM 21115 TaxID=1413187 RepID=A0A0R2NY35_9LACO|nr:hypothetical protein [Lactiplantibacillus fabifermentans]KRO28467.1 hypothetical protein DY78_GL002366 [Lactiplantibacillus fabifermentans DSM 21115]
MATIKLTDFKDPSNDVNFEIGGKQLYLKSHDDLMVLLRFADSKRMEILGKYKTLIRTYSKVEKEQNVQRLLDDYNKHSKDIESEMNHSEQDLQKLYQYVFDRIFVDELGQDVEAGDLVATTLVSVTAITAFFDKIVDLINLQDKKIAKQIAGATGAAFKAAGALLDGDEDVKNAKSGLTD